MNVQSHTKINLGLKVLNLRSDNYHNIETFFVEIDFGDKLEIKKINSVDVEITWDPPWNKDMMSDEAKLELGFL